MANKLENILSKIIKYGLYAILLTPLVFWPRALFPFLTPKFILFQILIEIVFGAWVLLAIFPPKTDQHRPKFSWITVALLSFIAVSFISAFLGIDFQRSFWGIGARLTGLFAELHFFAWFLVLISVSKSGVDSRSPTSRSLDVRLLKPVDMVKYLNFSFFVALIVALTSFYQNPKWALAFGYGIFNNPTFAASYLIFHFFWGLYQTLNYKIQNTKYKTWLYGIGTALLLFIILFVQIRGAILGLLIGIFVLGACLILSNILSRRSRILLSAFYFLLSITLVGLWYLRDNQFIQSFSPIKRVTGISLSETTVQTRLLVWRIALKGVKDAPFFGTGPENFNYIFNAHYNPRLLKFGGNGFGETWFDKPHNAILEVSAETGIIGGLAYVLVWFAAIVSLFKLFKSDLPAQTGQKLFSIILISAFSAYLGTVFFSFDSFGSWFGLFLFLAVLVLSGNGKEESFLSRINFNNGIKKIAAFAITIIVAYLILFNYSVWRANLSDADALRIFSTNPVAGIELFKNSLSYKSPYKSEYQFDLIASVGGAIEKNIPINNLEEAVNFILNEADKAISAHPNNASSYTDMLRIYNIFGTKGRDPEILAQAEAFGAKSLALSPNRQETLFYLARTALLQNRPVIAVQLAKQAVTIDSAIGTSHWYLGLAFVANNQTNEGIREIKEALSLGYNPRNDVEKNFIESLGL